jgi:Fe-S oxidoreductase
MVWVGLAQLPGIFLYAYLGTLAQLGIKLFQRTSPPHPYEYVVWIGGLVLTAAVTVGIGRVALRMLGEAGATVSEAVNGTAKVNGTPAEAAEPCEIVTQGD